MRPNDVAEMRGLRIFKGVGCEHVEDMLCNSFLQKFPAHVDLALEGEPADFLHVVVDGSVEIFSSYRDRKTTMSVLGPGQCFIMAAVVLDRVYLKSARSLEPSRILLIPAGAVRASFAKDAAFARCLAADLALSYRMVVKELKNQKLRSGLERLANWLLVHDESLGAPRCFDLPFEKKILAAHIGVAPEVLSRLFGSLAAYGVNVQGKYVEIGDIAALRTLAKPVPTIDDHTT